MDEGQEGVGEKGILTTGDTEMMLDVGGSLLDVEGFEEDVLLGVTSPLPALSIEFLPASIGSALAAIDRLEDLGSYRFNYSMVERMQFAASRWLCADEIRAIVSSFGPTDRSGDIYAVRSDVIG